jgi:hypothetical protein
MKKQKCMWTVHKRFIIVIFIVIITVSLTFAVSFTLVTLDTTIRQGVSISNIPVGGLSKSSALKKLKSKYPLDPSGNTITLKCDSTRMQISYKELGVEYDYMSAIDEAFTKGRSGNTLDNYFDTLLLLFSNLDIPIVYKVDENSLEKAINKFSKKVEIPFVKHSLTVKDSTLILQNGKTGALMDRNNSKLKTH